MPPPRRAALAAMLLMGGVLAGYLYFISLYLQDSLGFSALVRIGTTRTTGG